MMPIGSVRYLRFSFFKGNTDFSVKANGAGIFIGATAQISVWWHTQAAKATVSFVPKLYSHSGRFCSLFYKSWLPVVGGI